MKNENNDKATPLSPKHQLFVNEMLVHGKRTRAYLAAYPGGSAEAARTNAARLLKNPAVARAMEEGMARLSDMNWEMLKQDRARELQRITQKRDMLEDIYMGRVVAQKAIKTEKGEDIRMIVDPGAMLKAIKQDLKLKKYMDKSMGRNWELEAELARPDSNILNEIICDQKFLDEFLSTLNSDQM